MKVILHFFLGINIGFVDTEKQKNLQIYYFAGFSFVARRGIEPLFQE